MSADACTSPNRYVPSGHRNRRSQDIEIVVAHPTDEAALKLLYLVLNRSEKAWKMGPREWVMAKAQFAVIFGERFTRAMAA